MSLLPVPPMRQARLADATAQPWRNGGGVTRELLAWPAPQGPQGQGPHAGTTPWNLRVSVADITQDGPFSAFPGHQRCFAVLEGAGVVLSLRGADQVLGRDSEPLAFDGADAPGCRLVDGATRDLNLMVRHGAGHARMQRARTGERWPPGPAWAWLGLYTHGPARLEVSGSPIDLPAGTLAWSDPGAAQAPASAGSWCLAAGTQAWWLGLSAAQEQGL